MAKKFICVEVGDRLVKVAVCTGTEKKRKILSAFFYETPEETVQEGGISDPSKFALTLMEQMKANKCDDAKEIFFSIATTKVLTREVAMKVAKASKIQNVVDNNKTDYFPLDLSNHTVLFREMTRPKKGEKNTGTDVLVMAMPNVIIDACGAIASGLKLRLRGVDAVCSCFVDGAISLKQSQLTAFVHVDCTFTNLCVMRGADILFQRAFAQGGDEMISAYREAVESDIGYYEALQQLSSMSAEDNVRGKLDDDAITSLLSRVIGAVQSGVRHCQNNKAAEIQQIVLSGPCSGLLGLEELLEGACALPTMQMKQISAATALRSITEQPTYFIAGLYAGASGLNFGKFLDIKKQKGKRATGMAGIDMPTAILIFILLIVFAAYWAYSAIQENARMEAELARLNQEIADMKYLDDLAALHTSYSTTKDLLLTFAKNTENPNEQLVQFLAELEAKMPSEILILSAGCTSTAVNMNIVVGSLVEAATVISKLRTFESISVIQVSGLGLVQTGDPDNSVTGEGYDEVSFSVVCNYGINPYTSGLNPYSEILGLLNPPTTPEVSEGTEAAS